MFIFVNREYLQHVHSYRLFLLIFLPITLFANTQEFNFDNGLKLIVKEDKRAPIAAVHLWYHVGSSYEPKGLTGISHVLEHMMFKGTTNTPSGEFSRIIAQHGGNENAFTSLDYTSYQHFIPASKLGIVFELEADRMKNLNFTDDEFAKEMQVIMEERRVRVEDVPTARVSEQLYAVSYQNGYQHPVIGWKRDLTQMTAEAVRAWYQKWYQPNNLTLVVAGGVNAQQVYQMVKRHFGSIASSPLPKVVDQSAYRPIGQQSVSLHLNAKQPHLFMAFKIPTITGAKHSWEPYAIEVLGGVLAAYDSSRLNQSLVKQQGKAAYISASASILNRLPGLFIISTTSTGQSNSNELQQAIMDEVKNIKQTGITEKELTRVKNQLLAEEIYGKDSVSHQAYYLGYLDAVGLPWQLYDDWIEGIKKVKLEQVRLVAERYFHKDNLAVATLIPTEVVTHGG